MPPKVTVIIPCFNREKFIRETVDSSLSQTYANLKIVAVDDGSTDGTRKVLESYGGDIKLLEHPGRVNKGQSAAINLAMRSTESKYVAILDSDDVWKPEKIECQLEVLEKSSVVGLVYANGFAIDENDKILYKLFPSTHVEKNRPEQVLLDCYIHLPSNSLIRRSSLNAAGEFDETMRSAQDHDMIIRLAEITKFAYLDEPLWYYRKHSDTQSMKYARRRWANGFKILNKACKRRNYSLNTRRKRFAVLYFRIGQCFLEERLYIRAAFNIVVAGIFDPVRAVKVLLRLEKWD